MGCALLCMQGEVSAVHPAMLSWPLFTVCINLLEKASCKSTLLISASSSCTLSVRGDPPAAKEKAMAMLPLHM